MPRKPKKTKSKVLSPVPSKENPRMEFARQLLHVCVGLGLMAVLLYFSLDIYRTFIFGLLFVGIILSLIAKSGKISVFNRMLKMVERPHEGVPGQGAFFFLVGVGIPAFLFSSSLVVLTGLVALTFQDSFSTLIGRRFGKTKLLGKKTLEGAIGGFIPCFLALFIFLSPMHALAVAFAATVVELLPVEDAVSIPIVSGFLISMLK